MDLADDFQIIGGPGWWFSNQFNEFNDFSKFPSQTREVLKPMVATGDPIDTFDFGGDQNPSPDSWRMAI